MSSFSQKKDEKTNNDIFFDKNYIRLNHSVIDEPNNILNLDKNNGRVDLLKTNEDPAVVFRMQERIAIKNKATEYRDALTGIWENTVLSKLYFSSENIQILQNAIRAGVYKMSNNRYVIAPPNIDTLKIIMRSIYLQNAQHEPDRITEQIEQLNKLVLDYAIPSTFNEAVGYEKYCEDQSTLVVPLELPLHHDRQYKQLELKPWF
jgi:hypothetical protein